MMRWFFSPLLIVAGIAIMKYTVALTNITGPVGFAEEYLKLFGGTYGFWRLIGLGLCIFGLMMFTGVIKYNSGTELELQLLHLII